MLSTHDWGDLLDDEPGSVHIYPETGPEHDCLNGLDCWCQPFVIYSNKRGRVVMHLHLQ